jgi:histidinol dehydrogenase
MRVERFDWDGSDARGLASTIRDLQPALGEVSDPVRAIVDAIREEGDSALVGIESRFAGGIVDADSIRRPDEEIASARSRLELELIEAMELAAANIRAVADAQLAETRRLELAQGQKIELREVPVGSAGIYAPGGAAAYPSTVLMGCIPARVAGVERVVVATPAPVSDVTLAAAAIAEADEVYAMGGAQAIAALALGTERIDPVDVIAGPGNRYVQEAKRQLAGEVGIDGIAGPSELMVIAGDTANAEWMGLDLCSQAEHGSDGLLVAAAVETVILDEISDSVERIAADRGIADDAVLALVAVPETEAGVTLANAIAPEHLEILTEDAELLAERVTSAGCASSRSRPDPIISRPGTPFLIPRSYNIFNTGSSVSENAATIEPQALNFTSSVLQSDGISAHPLTLSSAFNVSGSESYPA